MLLELDGLSEPIAFVGCDEVARDLARVLRGWRIRERDGSPHAAPLITVEKVIRGFRLASPWNEKPVRYFNRVDTVCSVIADLIESYVAADPSLLCLHCAAAEFEGRLVVFPNTNRAGKSLLSVSLAAAGARIFSDDVLPIDGVDNHGVAPGILPRLRLPLPDDTDAAFRDYVESRADLGNRRYLYVDVGDEGLARLGEKAPIGGFVLLRRVSGVKASIEPVKKSEMLKRVILRNFAHDVWSSELVDRLHDLVDGARCCRLRYSHVGDAADLLRRTFDHWQTPSPAIRSVTSTTAHAPTLRGQLIRAAGISEHMVDDEMFLIDQNGEAVYHLNATSAAIWCLLAEPTTREDAVETLRQAFPDVPVKQVERDVRALLAYLASRGLISGAP